MELDVLDDLGVQVVDEALNGLFVYVAVEQLAGVSQELEIVFSQIFSVPVIVHFLLPPNVAVPTLQ